MAQGKGSPVDTTATARDKGSTIDMQLPWHKVKGLTVDTQMIAML